MEAARAHIHHLHTEAGKIRVRILHIRHITRRITAPEVVSDVADPADLYRSLDSLNQLIEAYEEQLADFELRTRSAAQLYEQSIATVPEYRDGIISRDMLENLRALGALMTEFRTDMAEDLAAADSILHLFTEAERR
ncbi:MAG: hypothetical protein GVY29_11415 [Spirochaetes bacterium]|jgi:phytoene dehydrogenase-like protein|nr:hypothetical protein [Spirochaetota bacterium]